MVLPTRTITAGAGLAGGGTTMHSDRAFAALTGTSAGTLATGNDSRFLDTKLVIRSSDLTMDASASVSIGLSFAYAASETWLAKYTLWLQTTAGVGGLNFKLNTLPTDVVGRMSVQGPTSGLTAFGQQVTTDLTVAMTVNLLTVSAVAMVNIDLVVRSGSAAGTIDLMLVTGLLQAGTVFRESCALCRRA